MSDYKNYRKKTIQKMRPYVPGESLEGVSVSPEDTPELGGMIVVNADNEKDKWYISKGFFESNYELVELIDPPKNLELVTSVELVIDSLSTGKYTKVFHEKDIEFNAPHHFTVVDTNGHLDSVAHVDFQKGPILENGVNGVSNEDLLNMVRIRLMGFQDSPYKCRENAIALTKLEEALLWLRKRTNDRNARGVEGTHKV